jgi:hypothetical protein
MIYQELYCVSRNVTFAGNYNLLIWNLSDKPLFNFLFTGENVFAILQANFAIFQSN